MSTPRVFPPATASYVAFYVLLDPPELLARGQLRLEAPMHDPVVFHVVAQRPTGLEVEVGHGQGPARRQPWAHMAVDLVDKRVTPLRLRLAGRDINLLAPQALAPADDARRLRVDAQDLLCSFLNFLVAWCYHAEGSGPRAWRTDLPEEEADER